MTTTHRAIALAALLVATIAGNAPAQSTVPHSVLAPGGRSNDSVYQLYGVVGQAVAGELSGPADISRGGYAYAVADLFFGTPTAVTISHFSARLQGTHTELSWEIAHARELRGFNLYRATLPAGPFVRVNGDLLSPASAFGYTDHDLAPATTYDYRLGAVDRDGEFLSAVEQVTTPAWRTELRQNTPNPFNPATTISFYLARPGPVTLTVYDVTGALVTTLVARSLGEGSHEVDWSGTDARGRRVGSGVYFYRLETRGETLTRKLTLLK